ncbi:hypothetical protein C8J56DRAFT_1053176 [Mycena floridula]|nr:hypothetical protein C8J56DRAFT_1053176 [Mycena floridula]
MKVVLLASFALIFAVAIGQEFNFVRGNDFVDDLSSRDVLDIPEDLSLRDLTNSDEYLYGRDLEVETELFARYLDDDELLARDHELDSRELEDHFDMIGRDFDDWEAEIMARDFEQLPLEARSAGTEDTGEHKKKLPSSKSSKKHGSDGHASKSASPTKKSSKKKPGLKSKDDPKVSGPIPTLDQSSLELAQQECDKNCAVKNQCKPETIPSRRIISEIDRATCAPGYDPCLEACMATTIKTIKDHADKLPKGSKEKKEMEELIKELNEPF